MARISEEERENAVELIEAGSEYDGVPNPGDASEQWGEFESFRDQAESARRGMLIWVYRIPTDAQGIPVTGGDTSLLFTAPIDTYPSLPMVFNRVKKEYMPRGAGRTLIRIQVRREKKPGVLWQKVFTIEKGTSDDEPETSTVKPLDGIGDIARVIQQAMAAQAEQNRALIATLIARQNSASPVDALAQTREMISMVAALTTAMNGRPVAAPGPAASVTEQLQGFREMMKFARDMGGEFGGGDDDEPGALGVLKSLTPWAGVFEKLLTGMQNRPALPAPPMQRPPMRRRIMPPNPNLAGASAQPSVVTAQPAPPVNPKTPEDAAMLLKIVEFSNELITLKNNGADPAVIGKQIPDALTPEIESRVLDLLERPDWFKTLSGFNPLVREHEEFFTKVRDAFMAEYEIEGDAATTETPTG